MRLAACLCATLLASCAIPNTIGKLGEHDQPPELGRSRWVRVCAGTGAWVGGVIGGVVSVVLLPIDYPLSLLASDGLGERTRSDFLWWPALGGAAFGHAALGGPADVLDYLGYRVWTQRCDLRHSFVHVELWHDYDLVPMAEATLPAPSSPPAAPNPSAPAAAAPQGAEPRAQN
jgi:hypothetical protein